MVEAEKVDCIEFKWCKKRGVGGKKKDVQFYESFFYDGVDYTLYDSVYMYKEGEPEPYIGKLIKIWENADKTKKVKVLWFFRPREISNYLGDEKTLKNELFLASGEGVGNANVNPLEAIAGKCNVVCSSKDSRNPLPSDEELQEADFVFYRAFDVGNCRILDKIDEKIAGIEVKFLLNRVGNQNSSGVPKLDSNKKEVSGNAVVTDDTRILAKKESYLGEKAASSSGVQFDEVAKTNERQVLVEEKLKVAKASGDLDDRSCKKAKLDDSAKASYDNKVKSTQKLRHDSNDSSSKAVAQITPAAEDKSRPNLTKDPQETNNALSEKPKPDEKLANGKFPEASLRQPSEEGSKTTYKIQEPTRRPATDRSKWFRGLPWEETMQTAHEQGTLVLLQNLDPSYTSAEVEDLIWQAFKQSCTAKMIQRTAHSSPHSVVYALGQAFVIFQKREVAEMAVAKLDEVCLMLSNGRPLVGSIAAPCFPGKQSTFFGHLTINKLRIHMQREMKEAVSTSHCSQPNTLEYDMAMEWCLLQDRSDLALRKLRQQQEQELRKLRATLKSK
ncbi:protein ANTI-SILENCING 1-like isoform X1 [Populus nigra]|uniref:protein ANTI-SILENCING 1-like isoform X1 n=1 Tax=Populus nigra TaxID=3691 RepID=UPI002B275C99|nr:protein ANTI-SILENCING 1-like isoform X1 [Populus nigra]XP_061950610.1 protein ANTI-SILENCING 1-like isoform X1 [Populus nigra]